VAENEEEEADDDGTSGTTIRTLGTPRGEIVTVAATHPMRKVASMLHRHRGLIMNWFRAKGQISSAVVEGFNHKAKLTFRKARRFRKLPVAEAALCHTPGDLPEPDFVHRFC
jgi:hypothetical protein